MLITALPLRDPEDRPLVPFLEPLIDGTATQGSPDVSWMRRFEGWQRVAHETFSLVDDERASVSVVPIDWYWVRGPSWASRPDRRLGEECRRLVGDAADQGRPSLAFFTGDRSCDRADLRDTLVCREGGYRSRMGPDDLAAPAFVEDLVEHYTGGEVELRELGDAPRVGFCGLAGRRQGPPARARELAHLATVAARERRLEPSQFTGENLRATVLASLAADDRCETNFIVRDGPTFFVSRDPADLVDVRRQYVDNLRQSDYSLCIRGSGNYSYRLYETLALGRIPIIVDTDLALPARDVIDWPDVGVWVDHDDLDHIGDILTEFHASLDRRRFEELQLRARRIWVQHLSPAGWFSALPHRIERWLEERS
ncbi:exostosin domain-containing protein [Ilumatobacter sp.]|uniref:exostosin domain-containing protein n=1 Tax=Ilumatobacter sp. TaxID=1967498 RepID=UPI003B521A0F